MHVLVCDDDKATRFVARKMLEGSFGCRVTECTDGLEALTLLGRERFSMVLLDIEMPTLNGVETLEEIRESAELRDLPVIVLSFTRDKKNVMRLVELGITDYILKPIHGAVAHAKLDRVIRTLPATEPQARDVGAIRLSQKTPAMLVDGNLDFRFFFKSQMSQFGAVLEADSGASAIAAFRRNPIPLVFIGGNLGVVSEARLIKKLTELSAGHPVRFVRVADADEPMADEKAYDGIVPRSYIPDTLRARMRPYVYVPGALNALTEAVPELADIVDSAARQVFGMMFDTEVKSSELMRDAETPFVSRIDIEVGDRFIAQLRVHLTRPSSLTIASRMFSMPEADLIDEDCASTAQEIGNLLMGRMVARFRDRALTCRSHLPVAETVGPVKSFTSESLVQAYALPTESDFFVSVTVVDRLDAATQAAPAAAASVA